MAGIVYSSFPRTEPPKPFAVSVVDIFRANADRISTVELEKGLESNEVMYELADGLEGLGFKVERSKKAADKIHRPVFFGDNGEPMVQYQIDAYHKEWCCGLEIEAGRAWMGNAVYRDLIQSLVMVELDHLILAVPQTYKYLSAGKPMKSKDFENTKALVETLYGHTRMKLPYSLTLIGY